MKQITIIIQMIVAGLLIVTILIQQKGSGIGSAFGGGSEFYSTKRGAEKFLHYSSIVLSVIFLGIGLALIFI